MQTRRGDRDPAGSAPSTLMQRLLGRLRARQHHRVPKLAPAGERSGEGTESIAPYLEQTRSTRPGPLE